MNLGCSKRKNDNISRPKKSTCFTWEYILRKTNNTKPKSQNQQKLELSHFDSEPSKIPALAPCSRLKFQKRQACDFSFPLLLGRHHTNRCCTGQRLASHPFLLNVLNQTVCQRSVSCFAAVDAQRNGKIEHALFSSPQPPAPSRHLISTSSSVRKWRPARSSACRARALVLRRGRVC